MRQYSSETVIKKLKEKKITLKSSYINSREKIEVSCDVCKKEWSSIAQTPWLHGCKFCNIKEGNFKAGRSKAYTDEEFKKILHPDIESLDPFFTKHTPIRIKCLLCGNIRKKVPHHYFDGNHHCPICGPKRRGDKRVLPNTTIDERLKKVNLKRLSNYDGKRSPLKVVCLVCGKKWTRVNNASLISGCSKCEAKKTGLKIRLTTKEVKKILKKKSIKLLSEFVGTSYPGKFRCIACQHTWGLSRFTHLLYITKGCPRCMVRDHNFYKASYFKKNPKMKNVASSVYLVKLSLENEKFCKIGITKNSIKQRFRSISYKVKLLAQKKDTLYNCYLLEKKLKKLNRPMMHRPLRYFPGASECFKFNLKLIKSVKSYLS